MRAVVSDIKLPQPGGTFHPDLLAYFNYYPFGQLQPNRYNPGNPTLANGYRYGFNGKEKDNNGELGLTTYDYGARMYSPALGRFFGVDPATAKFPDLSPFVFAGNSPIKFFDRKGEEPDRSQAGTISQAAGEWAALKNPSVSDIRQYIQNNEKATRYVYTKEKGWVDLLHYFSTIERGKIAMDILEPASGSSLLQRYIFGRGADESYYSYEDLPSNAFADEFRLGLSSSEETTNLNLHGEARASGSGDNLKTGSRLIEAVTAHLSKAGATIPEDAPNWRQLPFRDHELNQEGNPIRQRLPEGLSPDQLSQALQLGNFVPQNHSSNPYDLKNFAPAPTSLDWGDTRVREIPKQKD